MKVLLTHKVFTESPYVAFSKRHKVSPKLWDEMYNKRYKWHGYEIPILAEYYNLKTKSKVAERTIRRWIKRTDIYTKAQHAINKGVREVSHHYFEPAVTLLELEDILDIKHESR